MNGNYAGNALESRVEQLEAYNRRLIQLLEKNLIKVPDEIMFDDIERMGNETYYDLYYKLDSIESELRIWHTTNAATAFAKLEAEERK